MDHFGPLGPNLGKNEFSWKKGSASFRIFKLRTKREKERDRADNGDFKGPSVRRSFNLLLPKCLLYDKTHLLLNSLGEVKTL